MLLAWCFGGEGGIRTPEALIQTCTLSRGVHSTSLPLLRRDPTDVLPRSKQRTLGYLSNGLGIGSRLPSSFKYQGNEA